MTADRRARAPDGRLASGPRRRALITPEGVDLELVVGEGGERATAFILDALFMVGALLALTLILLLVGAALHLNLVTQLLTIVWLLGFFCVRNLYFIGFELGPRAATPGKRIVGLRVASRSGARLTADAVIARNAMREIEIYLPLSFLIVRPEGIDAVIAVAGLVWGAVFAFFPLFNRDRLRVGDMAAGTWVVRSPRPRLGADLTAPRSADVKAFAFTPAQLDAYGVKELQVLETVLRRNNAATVNDVARRIRQKIGWIAPPSESNGDFLDAYYVALRAHLETGLLFGRRRRDKHDRP